MGIQPAGPDEWWLQVTDTGIGMSRFVLTNVLIDFGASLWASDAVREELPGLSKAKFKPVGKFGIGFFSVFMLGSEVRVTTRRYQPSHGESGVHWQLRFDDGLASRPALVRPSAADELPRSGTRVAVKLSGAKLKALLDNAVWRSPFDGIFKSAGEDVVDKPEARNGLLAWRVASLCPTSAVRLKTQYSDQALNLVVAANDWVNIPDDHLNRRVGCSTAPLFPLRRVDGELLGRVGIPPSMATSRYGAIVYEGVVSLLSG